jgi:hypothetical protein
MQRPEDIIFLLNKKWFVLHCGMWTKENRCEKGEMKLRLGRYGTNLYLAIYGAPKTSDGNTLMNIVPYALVENLRRKDIIANEEIKRLLAPQIEQIEKELAAFRIVENKRFLSSQFRVPETVQYVLSPTRYERTRLVQEHKLEVGVVGAAAALLMILTSLAVTGFLASTLFIGSAGITITASIGIIGLLIRRRRE